MALAAQIQNLTPVGPVPPAPSPLPPPFVGGGGGTLGDNFDEVLEFLAVRAEVETAPISAIVMSAPVDGGAGTASAMSSAETAVVRARVRTE